jgi:hypothetical protein
VALILTSSCAASPQLFGEWDWNLFAHFPDYYAALIPTSEQQETTDLSTDNLLTQSVDHAATLALVSLVMCVKETKGMVKTSNTSLFMHLCKNIKKHENYFCSNYPTIRRDYGSVDWKFNQKVER